ncbi:hypothetical protein QNI19_19245 [Cytophagaceae bacterium DM2B3-1]|uniref:Lipocalin-like domain-containing protein n=1 Tax=Xanthocytophaga flava TaxID=3048013 RepID=A0ABT7CMV5_9BACT|nr:hypothetical protein [Xanthocytophaga flavus]MDJ1495083.1 hypothetical protein [Xanthocytophaga flavus]
MRQFRQLFLLAILALTVFACNKDDDPSPSTKADLLASKKWKIQSLTINNPLVLDTVNGQPVAPTDWYNSILGDCEKDDIISFRNDGNKVYTAEDVGTHCPGSTTAIWQIGSWVLSSDETEIYLSNGFIASYYIGYFYGISVSETWKITKLDNSKLEVTFPIGDGRAFTYTFIAVE